MANTEGNTGGSRAGASVPMDPAALQQLGQLLSSFMYHQQGNRSAESAAGSSSRPPLPSAANPMLRQLAAAWDQTPPPASAFLSGHGQPGSAHNTSSAGHSVDVGATSTQPSSASSSTATSTIARSASGSASASVGASSFPSTAALVNQKRLFTGDKPKKGVPVKDLKFNNEVIFLPERLLYKRVLINDPVLVEILSKRGCKIRVNIPSWPGTSDSILEVIKQAFKDQKHKVDLDAYGVEYAYLADKSHLLLPLPVATEDVNASMFERYYRNKSCVIIPMILDHDPDLHGLFYDDEDENEHNKIEEPVSELSVVATVAQGDKRPSSLLQPALSHHRCPECLEPVPCEDDMNEHREVCPRSHLEAIPQGMDSEDETSWMPDVTHFDFPDDLAGIHESAMPFILRKKAKWQKYLDEIDKERAEQDDRLQKDTPLDTNNTNRTNEPHSDSVTTGSNHCFCGDPDEKDNMIQCEACPVQTWFHYGCADVRVRPKSRWRCASCTTARRQFWDSSPPTKATTQPSQSKQEGKKRQRSLSPLRNAQKEEASTSQSSSKLIIPRRATSSRTGLRPRSEPAKKKP